MRIAVFSDTYLPQVNGVSKTLNRMKEHMNREGIESVFITPASPAGEEGIMALPGLRFFLYPELSLALPRYFYVRRVMDEFKPQLVHLATEFSVGLMGLKYALGKDCSLTASYHTNFPEYLDYYHLSALEGIAWKYLGWFHSHMQTNFCPSQATARLLSQHGIPNLNIMGRGIDEEGFSPLLRSQELRRAWHIPDDCVLLLYVGRLAAEKELEVLMEAMPYLGERPYRLMMVGDGPMRQELEQYHDERIILTGYRSGEELQRIYASADIFVFPSSTETYGNVILEAMASGIPVTGPRAGGVQENLIEEYNGLYFKPHDAQDMAASIKKLMDNPDLRRQLGQNAYRHGQSHTWKEVFRQVFNCYRQLVEESSFDKQGLASA
ncbi:MAG: glycosyltransferase family 1 protein [Syntrophomonadaceae bacterium]|nr:glycosyltransferase family 1 protein [Syntrophomonadaceae bacterium]